ncbi:hypothetical protein SAMN02745857_02565 [Andreprevotia lacus DSM 23236]|jgi:hypothetical protein|uniref:Ceramidase n=1 Tax=Andreprevotia lacus DSM 23236 TaxID=1121001 RepID=A0A1W1XSZ9_9NEIS|nr:hypothetical protein [Andreprevotia lacus]SMC26658.1 hypothetical protein SAMN02745857_02565 [Andreprevotia lacus DSM 23236]
MKLHHLARALPGPLIALITIALLWHGPIAQFQHYHDFADQRGWGGLPHAADVLSNLPFALVGLWGLLRLWPLRQHGVLARSWPAWLLFLLALLATYAGSSWYHLAPDDHRLVWDRLPIALACAGLLAAVYAETQPVSAFAALAALLGLTAFGVAGVAWWAQTADLRPYLLLQGMPLLLVPLWQWSSRSHADLKAFGLALGCYVLAKAAELTDMPILLATDMVSGHTLKHLLAALAAAIIVGRLIARAGTAEARGLGYPRPA